MIKPTQEQAFAMLAARLEHARREHPVFANSEEEAVDVIWREWTELRDAEYYDEGPTRILDGNDADKRELEEIIEEYLADQGGDE